jgi:hypothetical protein
MGDVARHQALGRQQQIWANLYGPARAAVLAGALAELLDAQPGLALRDAVARLDPEDEGEYTDFVATRW